MIVKSNQYCIFAKNSNGIMEKEEEKKDLTEQATQVPTANEGDVAPAESAETPAEPTARQKALARLRSRKADREFADDDDDAVFGAINDDYDEDNAELEGYRADAEKWNKFLGSDYKANDFMSSWMENGSPVYAMIDEYGEDIVADITNPDNKEKVKEHEAKRLERIAKEKELEDEYNNNIETSKALVQSMKETGQYTPEQIDGAIDSIKESFMKFLTGMIDESMIVNAIKANGYDEDKANAAAEAEVKGRNAAIGKEFNKRKTATDGIPALGGGAQKTEHPTEDTQRYGRRTSMWE